MRHEGIHGSGGDVVVTEGFQQALDLVSRMFRSGRRDVAEGAFPRGALRLLAVPGRRVPRAPLDDDGLDPDALAATLERLDRDGRRVKLLYTVPNTHTRPG